MEFLCSISLHLKERWWKGKKINHGILMIDSKFSKAKIIRKCMAESKENLSWSWRWKCWLYVRDRPLATFYSDNLSCTEHAYERSLSQVWRRFKYVDASPLRLSSLSAPLNCAPWNVRGSIKESMKTALAVKRVIININEYCKQNIRFMWALPTQI